MKRSYAKIVGLSLCLMSINSTGFAAAKKSMGLSTTSSGGGKEADRDFLISIPVVADSAQARLHLEYNVQKTFGLALEAAALGEKELLSPKEIDASGDSLKTKGTQVSLLFARYSEPAHMGGFFFALGAGYRQYTAEWKKKPDDQNKAAALQSNTSLAVDDTGYLHHRVKGSGTTGHARVGYRWVAAEWPVSVGGHLGMRHVSTSVKDVDVDEEKQKDLKLNYSPTNDAEKKSLKNRVMTERAMAIELGVVF